VKGGIAVSRLETRGYGAKTFFARDVQPLVLQACRQHGISFEDYAAKLGMNRAALVLILKGHDPVPRHVLDSIRSFVESSQPATAA
jgi:cyanate lyase